MIDIKELRVGNWLLWVNMVPVKYSGTALYGSGPWEMQDKNLMPQVEYGGYPFYQVAWENLSPIPLSPEVLRACGFEEMPTEYCRSFKKDDMIEIEMVDDDKYMARLRYDWSDDNEDTSLLLCEPKFLHQLQNLYFALTSKELSYQP